IRVNSQSGKGGITYIMRTYHGFELPRRLQIEFSRVVQKVTDASGQETDPQSIYEVFEEQYLSLSNPVRWIGNTTSSTNEEGVTEVAVDLEVNGSRERVQGRGNGPIAAFVEALSS